MSYTPENIECYEMKKVPRGFRFPPEIDAVIRENAKALKITDTELLIQAVRAFIDGGLVEKLREERDAAWSAFQSKKKGNKKK